MVWWVGYWMAATVATGLALLISLQAWEHRRFVRSRIAHPHTSGPTGHALVVVACKGSDGGLEANLRPLFEQTYADYQLVFAVEGACDPCCGVIRQLQTQYPHRQTRLIFAGLSSDCGQKVHNLLAATDAMSRDVAILAFIDADVRPARKWLSRLTQRLDRFNVATGYRWFIPERPSLPNNLLASIDSAVISLMFPGKHSLVWGGSWAIRRDTFDRLPLRQAWQGTLSDDLVASCVLAQAREPVALEPACIVTSPLDVDCAEMFAFLRRQLTIGRHYAPRLWGMMLVLTCLTQSMLWVSLATATWGICQRATWAWQPALVAALLYGLHAFRAWLRQEASCSFVSRRWAGVAAARRFDQWAAPLAGAVCSLGLLCSATGRQIVWKGITYEMGTAGRVLRIVHRSASPRERCSLLETMETDQAFQQFGV